MSTSQSLLVVLTHPTTPMVEDEYNDWYSNNHLQDVMLSKGFPSANRYRQKHVLVGKLPPYVALYQADHTPEDAQEAYATKNRELDNGSGMGNDWTLSPGMALSIDWWSYYRKIHEAGSPSPYPDAPPGILLTFSEYDQIFSSAPFEEWSQRYVDAMSEYPAIRGATTYKLGLQAGGELPPRYMTVYELNGPIENYESVHDQIMDWVASSDDQRLEYPSPGMMGTSMAQVKFWGYYDTIISRHASTLEELMATRA